MTFDPSSFPVPAYSFDWLALWQKKELLGGTLLLLAIIRSSVGGVQGYIEDHKLKWSVGFGGIEMKKSQKNRMRIQEECGGKQG